MGRFGIGIITKDRPTELARHLQHTTMICKAFNIPLYVFDNSVETDNSELMKTYPDIIYRKHPEHLTYDQSYRYAAEHIDADYRWVLSDRIMPSIGAIPYINDYLNAVGDVEAIIVGFNGRLILVGDTYLETDARRLMQTVAWHTTLCSATIYHKDTVAKAEKDRYMELGYIQTAMVMDAVAHDNCKVLVIPHSMLITFSNLAPVWLGRYFEMWTNHLHETSLLLPKFYDGVDRRVLCRHNGYMGNLLTREAFTYLATIGMFTEDVLNKWRDDIEGSTLLTMKELEGIAKDGTRISKQIQGAGHGNLSV